MFLGHNTSTGDYRPAYMDHFEKKSPSVQAKQVESSVAQPSTPQQPSGPPTPSTPTADQNEVFKKQFLQVVILFYINSRTNNWKDFKQRDFLIKIAGGQVQGNNSGSSGFETGAKLQRCIGEGDLELVRPIRILSFLV